MRKSLTAGILGLFCFLFYSGPVWADLQQSIEAMKIMTGQSADIDAGDDVDKDGKIGLPEAIHHLQGKPDPEESCGAYVAPGVWKEFDCYNLAAVGKTTGVDPFTPSWELIGGYWPWGRKGADSSQWYDTNTKNFAHGPTGPGSSEANDGFISGWDSSDAPDGAWSDASKTANDPCLAGYRVPTKTQWDGVRNNNTQSTVGTWSSSYSDHTNYSAARFFGDDLMLPAAGNRNYSSGALHRRGYYGLYWSSSDGSSSGAWGLNFTSGNAGTNFDNRRFGFSVRCVAE
ncbi:MAG: fibrobacter succinogenes major paralogous domain-containing protein [Desulfotignum sp.]|nr:fibrobacter succinogenes major paralogous domain-containing protein [Desulfotignum sp.]MCF8090704.1 fibrobacter succinogenes major paralogous domain-containing protein [Desulfotignum sp.]